MVWSREGLALNCFSKAPLAAFSFKSSAEKSDHTTSSLGPVTVEGMLIICYYGPST